MTWIDIRHRFMMFLCRFKNTVESVVLTLLNCTGLPLISLDITGNTEQDSTTETITNSLANYIIPFRCGTGTFDMSLTNATNVRWLYDGTISSVSRFQETTVEDEVVWLLVDAFSETGTLNNNVVAQPVKLDLSDLQGKITKSLNLANCSLITGSLSDLQGEITYYLDLTNCSLLTGSLSDLQGKITYYLSLSNCSNVTGSLSDLQGKITYYLILANCSLITGSLSDLQGKITYYLSLANCSNVTGVYTPVGTGVPTTTNLSNTGLSSADMDATLIAYAGASKDNGSFFATGMTRTAASDTAVATLTGRGWAITGIAKE